MIYKYLKIFNDMANNKLAIIGGSGLYDIEEFKDRELLKLDTPWGQPSDDILKTSYKSKEIYFVTLMTIKPYDDKIADYFNDLDTILNKSNHSLIAIGKKAMHFNTFDFKSQVLLYPTVSELLKEL